MSQIQHERLNGVFDRELFDEKFAIWDDESQPLLKRFNALCWMIVALPDGADREEMRSAAFDLLKIGPPGPERDALWAHVEGLGTSAEWDEQNASHWAIFQDNTRSLDERLAALEWMRCQCTGGRTLKMLRLLKQHLIAGDLEEQGDDSELAQVFRELQEHGPGYGMPSE